MKRAFLSRLLTGLVILTNSTIVSAQLQVTEVNNAQQLAQRLVGNGVIIQNAQLTPNPLVIPSGFFNNLGGTNIGIDSGIVLSSGQVKSARPDKIGINGNGSMAASTRLADSNLGLPGDPTLANALGVPVGDLYDAVVLEFDFIPLGDSIKFNYVFGSEEYTLGTVCVYNDAFGFFISGPGISGEKNIALVPGTSTPVSIINVNDIAGATCINNPQYYVDNAANTQFNYDGHTVVFTAVSPVQACQVYHLKLVVSDVGDFLWDSGVFIQAKSLSSDAAALVNYTQTDRLGNNYLVEGCVPGAFSVTRPKKDPLPLTVSLAYAGSAINGVDIQSLPSSVIIPANDSFVTINITPLPDALAEGTDSLIIYALGTCGNSLPSDSVVIQIRDYDTLPIFPEHPVVCKRDSVQLQALPGYSSYQWNTNPTLSNLLVRDPFAKPLTTPAIYTCTATEGTCHYRDSIEVNIIPPVKIFAGQDTIAAIGQPLQLHVSAAVDTLDMQYNWSPAHYLNDPGSAAPITTLPNDYRYVVTGITPDGCKESDDIIIKVYKGPDIYVPSAFTPNNDGRNDLLNAVPVGMKELRFFRVFNRWGQVVFQTRDAKQGWNGKINGVIQTSGTYIWFAEGVDYKENLVTRKGYVTIIL